MVGDYIGTRMALKLSSEMKRTWVDVWLVWAVIASFASFYYYKFYLIQ